MKKNILVIGLGIGKLYKEVLQNSIYNVITCDIDKNKNPDYVDLNKCLEENIFLLIIICVPNYLHDEILNKCLKFCDKFLIEKPGINNLEHYLKDYVDKKFYIVKNNYYRDFNVPKKYDTVILNWKTKNRIPFPGSWFTDVEKSYGGVSKDIYPHFLNILCKLNYNLLNCEPIFYHKQKNWNLEDITSTDYGVVNSKGIYNVDDELFSLFIYKKIRYFVHINWKTNIDDDISLNFFNNKYLIKKIELGLCPEIYYYKMLMDILEEELTNIFDENKLSYEQNNIIDSWVIKNINR